MAVYTEISDGELTEFLAQYDLGSVLSCKGIAEGIENTNYALRTETGVYILTIYEKRVRREDLPFFLGLMDHLVSRGFPCATPVKGRDGQSLREVAGKPAAIASFLDGVSVRRPAPEHCAQLGDAMARLHLAAADFETRRANGLSLSSWRPLFESCDTRADEIEAGLESGIAAELDFVERAWPKDLPQGVIHADLFPDNVFFLGQRLSGVIDFYFACNDFLAYDLAVSLNAWCFENDGAFNITKAGQLFSAYGKVRPLDAAELTALPVLARGAALRFLLTRLHDWLNQVEGAFVRPKDPLEYWHKLRFHQGVSDAGAYGIA
jgi:homoserine kinase type II